MSDEHMEKIKKIEFAPYIQLAFILIDKPRKWCLVWWKAWNISVPRYAHGHSVSLDIV
jgi:hypothetical protein